MLTDKEDINWTFNLLAGQATGLPGKYIENYLRYNKLKNIGNRVRINTQKITTQYGQKALKLTVVMNLPMEKPRVDVTIKGVFEVSSDPTMSYKSKYVEEPYLDGTTIAQWKHNVIKGKSQGIYITEKSMEILDMDDTFGFPKEAFLAGANWILKMWGSTLHTHISRVN